MFCVLAAALPCLVASMPCLYVVVFGRLVKAEPLLFSVSADGLIIWKLVPSYSNSTIWPAAMSPLAKSVTPPSFLIVLTPNPFTFTVEIVVLALTALNWTRTPAV